VASGQAQFAELIPAERQAAHTLIDTRIARRAAAAQFGRPSGEDLASIPAR